MASKKMNYDAINFKNKDVDKFSTRFGKGPGDGLISQVKGMGDKLKNAPANTKDVGLWKTNQMLREAEAADPISASFARLTDKENNAYKKREELRKKFQPAQDKRSDMEKIVSESRKK